jgi:predicted RNA binding protein YcfA (HicA-like mRNA interferase family)
MGRRDKILDKVLSGHSDRNIPFLGLRNLLLRLGFEERIHGSHHVFVRPGIEGRINLQREGHQAKGYQVRQIRGVIVRYGLRIDE